MNSENPEKWATDLETVSGLMAIKYSEVAMRFPLLDDSEKARSISTQIFGEYTVNNFPEPSIFAEDIDEEKKILNFKSDKMECFSTPNEAKVFHNIDKTKRYPGTDWWQQRAEWPKRLTDRSWQRPFALEICGWHSKKWKSGIITTGLMKTLKDNQGFNMADLISEAIRNSTLNIGLAIGKDYAYQVLPSMRFKDITSKEFGCHCAFVAEGNAIGYLQPVKGNDRKYKVFRDDKGATIICTWARGGNKMPSKRLFSKFETTLYNKIQKLASNN